MFSKKFGATFAESCAEHQDFIRITLISTVWHFACHLVGKLRMAKIHSLFPCVLAVPLCCIPETGLLAT